MFPTPKVAMGAGLMKMVEGCNLRYIFMWIARPFLSFFLVFSLKFQNSIFRLNCAASWVHPATGSQLLLLGCEEGIFTFDTSMVHDGQLERVITGILDWSSWKIIHLQINSRRCTWLYVHKDILTAMQGKTSYLYRFFFQIKFIMIVLKKAYNLFYWIFVQHFNISDTIWSDWRRKIWHWKSRSSVSKWTRSLRSICLRSWPSPWGWPRQSRMMEAEFELRKQFSEERCNVRWYSERGRRRILRFWPSQLLPPFSSSNGAITIFI